MDRILCGAPTYRGKDYALPRWVAAYRALTYPAKGVFCVDNTPGTLEFAYRVRANGIPCDHLEVVGRFWDRLEPCWRRIVEYGHDEGYEYLCCIETDIVVPPNTLEVLLEELEHGADVVSAGVPMRGVTKPLTDHHLACTMTRIERLYQDRFLWDNHFEAVMWRCREGERFAYVCDVLEVEHLFDPAEESQWPRR